ncbi:MAG: hypothetical protein HRF50_07170 [Phycisphaerae bacterium]|jgi:hypothetical protein
MNTPPRRVGRRPAAARALTLAEIVVSTAIIGVVLVAALNAVGAAATASHKLNGRQHAVLLAEQLMNEILLLPYEDPVGPTKACSPESGEDGSNRGTFDDVDDYNGFKCSPPQDGTGAGMSDLAGFGFQAKVFWVSTADLATESGVETGLKRIEVFVEVDGLPAAELIALRSQAWDASQ